MYPSSDIAVPILSAVWNLGILGLVCKHDFSIPGSLGARWSEHQESLSADLGEIRRLLTAAFAFDDDVSAMVVNGWGGGPGWPEDPQDLDLYISFAAGRHTQSPAPDVTARKALVDWAARRLFAMTLEAALLAEWAATQEGRNVRENAASELLTLASRVAGGAAPFESSIVIQSAAEWLREETWTARDLPPALRDRLRNQMRILAAG